MNIPLFPTKLPPTLLRPNGYLPPRSDKEKEFEKFVVETASSSLESKPQRPVDVEAVVSHDEHEETLTIVVSVPSAPPQPKQLILRNIFQIPLVLLGFGFLYVRGLL